MKIAVINRVFHSSKRKKRGSALLVVLVVVGASAALMMTYFGIMVDNQKSWKVYSQKKQAQYYAESAIALQLYNLTRFRILSALTPDSSKGELSVRY